MAPTLNENGIPSFDSLPLREGDPPHSAWGLYGDHDELGTLNRLTDERVAAAAKVEIQKGTRIVHDDVWTFNSQVSSQWDGLRHFGYQKEAKFYNGVTLEDIGAHGRDKDGKKTTVNGIQAWAEQGIVGRGILIDLVAWREKQTDPSLQTFDCFATSPIPLAHLQACLRDQGTEVRFGDILFIRTGWHAQLATLSPQTLRAHQDVLPHHFGGVEQSEEVVRWIWENFSAVAGDQPSFEAWPSQKDWALHEVLLAGYGCPIGELFWLEKLAETCKKEGRWSFFVSSEVCNVTGGVASPPNILAIF
ncbi:hypothetical protein M406DRAFT_245045 [Cryphonectria parasitica EP155]|uniref:Cyclase n=1 Tax=Cryphonectria parasitica (strain ATCC 38755 / EP155) TaxID=660469 RepID=A0A9P5CW61_CRYP1|nr:uncharacterized protein M406DRAFT_245045 [Cryphonectria parasitica EP155]KAF3770990.1 hypothetical protein M406DRAFT_245045 [Cryphonectria parasitica EP155]